jgi:Zn finger protein HypA/HybF involved in hydrogenase expression
MVQFRKIERAKVVVKDGVTLYLKSCAKCGNEFYGTEDRPICDTCGKKKKKLKKGGGDI